MLEQARKLLADLSTPATGTDPKRSGTQWKILHTTLKKAPCDQMRLARYIAERNVEAMRGLLEEIAKAPPPQPRAQYGGSMAATGEAGSQRPASQPMIMVRAEKPTPQQLKTALAAFKKRLKLTKLDQESRIGRSPLTGGSKSNIVAILPPAPHLYPRIYWEELEKQGQIRNTGGGFYELVEKAKPLKNEGPAEAAVDEGSVVADVVVAVDEDSTEAVPATPEEASPSA